MVGQASTITLRVAVELVSQQIDSHDCDLNDDDGGQTRKHNYSRTTE